MAACCAILGAAQAATTFNRDSFPTCYGKEFTDRLFGLHRRAPSGNHDFDRLCAELEIEHRLTPPMRPQTNGLVERFNGRIEDVLQSHHFRSGEDLEQTILR